MKRTSHRTTRRGFLTSATAAVLGGVVGPRLLAGSTVAGLPYFDEKGWQIGCWTRPWSKFDYRVGFDAIAEAGFKYVGLTGAKTKTRRVIAPATTLEDSAKVGDEARKRGLKIVTAYGGGIPLDSDEALRKMIDNAAAAGAWSVLLAHVGKPGNLDLACKNVARCCDYAAEKKMAIVLKPHGGTTGTGPELRGAIEKIDRKNCTLMYDPGNILYYSNGEVDPVKDVAAVDGLVTGMSVKDYEHPKQVGMTPGSGQIDFAALVARMRKGGFSRGPLLIECLTPGDEAKTLAEAKKARRFVEQLVGASTG